MRFGLAWAMLASGLAGGRRPAAKALGVGVASITTVTPASTARLRPSQAKRSPTKGRGSDRFAPSMPPDTNFSPPTSGPPTRRKARRTLHRAVRGAGVLRALDHGCTANTSAVGAPEEV